MFILYTVSTFLKDVACLCTAKHSSTSLVLLACSVYIGVKALILLASFIQKSVLVAEKYKVASLLGCVEDNIFSYRCHCMALIFNLGEIRLLQENLTK